MRVIYSARTLAEANLVKDLLEAEGIEGVVQGEHLTALNPVVPESGPVVCLVNESDLARAEKIVSEFERRARRAESGNRSWICGTCGETSEAAMTQCWNCGATRKGGEREVETPPENHRQALRRKLRLLLQHQHPSARGASCGSRRASSC